MPEYHFQINSRRSSGATVAFREETREQLVNRLKPRVLMIGMHLTKTRGGITTLTSDILESTLSNDYEFSYLASQAEDFGPVAKLWLALTAACKFVWTCMFRSPRLVYVHVGSNASLYRESAFIVLARIMRRPVLSHFHAGDIDNYFPIQPWIGRVFIRFAIGLSQCVVAVSRESARQIALLDKRLRISLIPNAIDAGAFDKIRRTPLISGGSEPLRLLFVGAVGKLKGENDLIEALAILRNEGLDVRASFLGFGAERLAENCARRGVAGMIEHLGPVGLHERMAFYERADIFVLPTYAEAMPVSVIEAMAAGLPVISTAVGGIPEIIDHGVEGLLYPVGDTQALAESISRLLRDNEMRGRLGDNARKRVTKQMNFSTYIEKLRGEIMLLTPDSRDRI